MIDLFYKQRAIIGTLFCLFYSNININKKIKNINKKH